MNTTPFHYYDRGIGVGLALLIALLAAVIISLSGKKGGKR
jgi:hypothetical protein